MTRAQPPDHGTDLEAFVAGLPKVELHLHLEGSVRPETLLQLARRHRTSGLPDTPEGLRDFYRFSDFDNFVQVYYAICDNLRDDEDFALIVRELAETLAAQSVRYAEVTFTPYNHTRRGVSADALFEGVERGRLEAEAATGVMLRFCTDIPGEFGAEAGVETAHLVLGQRAAGRADGIVSFGLGGPEEGFARRLFSDAFAIARDAGLRSVPHAGETAGPASIRESLDHLGAERIGHGVRCLEDAGLVERLVAEQVPLEVCPTSNVCLNVVPSLAEHPLPRMLDAGLNVTLNSDDPPMFGTTLHGEYLAAATHMGLSRAQLVDLARAGVRAAFLDTETKQSLLAQIDAAAP